MKVKITKFLNMDKLYIITSEYVQHGMTFNRKRRYFKDLDKAMQVFDETVNAMKEDNTDMVKDKENYKIEKGGQKGGKFFYCYYKYQPQVSNFSVEMDTENLE